MDQRDIANLRNQMMESARRLSLDARAQEAYLRQINTWPVLDELALDFDDSYLPLADNDLLSSAELQAIESLQTALEAIGGPANARFWDASMGALSSSEWVRIRAQAAAASAILGSPRNKAGRKPEGRAK